MPERKKDIDNLSRFFQKAARMPQINFEEGDWKNMEALLDAEQSKTTHDSQVQWRSVVSVVGILFLSISTYVFISSSKNKSTGLTEGKSEHVVAESKKEAPEDLIVSKQPEPTKASESMNNAQSLSKNERTASGGIISNALAQKQPNASLKIVERNSVNSEVTVSTLKNANLPAPVNTVREIQTSEHKRISSDKEEVMDDRALNFSLSKGIAGLSLGADSINLSQMQEKTFAPEKLMEVGPADSIPDRDESIHPSRWNILLTASPDFSSTGLHRFMSPGDAWGMLVYYRLNDRLSISAGAIRSNKIYRDYGSNYKPDNENYWTKNTNGITPDEIQGRCSVLEIPIGLQYSIKQLKRSKVYAAAGLSNYIMLKESYQYTFSTPNSGAVEGWNAKKTTYSLFSVANFSAGYERSISKQIAIGISPYIKVPITGIGAWANVKLYSMGAAFTVRYSLQKKNRGDPF